MEERSIRKRLREKMIDRWENEGGKVRSEPSETNVSLPIIRQRKKARERQTPGGFRKKET